MRSLLAFLLVAVLPGLGWSQQTNTAPVAYAGPDQSIYLGESVYLNGTATDADGDAIVEWSWSVESAPTGSAAGFDNPSVPTTEFYADMLGTYVLTLVAFDGTDHSLPSSLTLTVALNQPPTALAAADVLAGAAPLTVYFDGSGSFDPEGLPLTYVWIFGDGTEASFEMSPTHVFYEPGIYTVGFQVTDTYRQIDQDSLLVVVSHPSNAAPTLSPVATPNSGIAPLTVAFAANASDVDNDTLTYTWDFGDPASSVNASTSANPTHVYPQEGTYVAWVTVSDGQAEASTSLDIVVSPAPLVSVSKVDVVEEGAKGNRKGRLSLWADAAFGTLASEDLISLVFDGVPVFAAPFGDFEAKNDSDTYVLVDRDLLVRIDLAAQQIMVQRRRVNLSDANLDDGADVTLDWGENTGVDRIDLTSKPGGVWTYTRN